MNTEMATKDSQVTATSKIVYRKPRYDVHAMEGAYRVDVHVPGVRREQTGITLEKNVLTITANRRNSIPEGWECVLREYETADYQLSLNLNVDVEENKISARTEDGVLSITLPIAEEAKPRVIAID